MFPDMEQSINRGSDDVIMQVWQSWVETEQYSGM